MKNISKKNENIQTSVALGYFDGLHLGHIEVIKSVLERETASCVLTFTQKTLLPKFDRSENILTETQKTEFLAGIGVEYIYAADFAEIKNFTPEEFVDEILIKKLNARYAACGANFHFGKGGCANALDLREICEKRGIELRVVPTVIMRDTVISSSHIRRLIKEGKVAEANEFLGYELTYDLPVVYGNQIGRTIDSPTINQLIPDGMIVPRFGVYKSWTILDGKDLPSITNIGVKPTVDYDGSPLMETHIVGFDGDLYGKTVKVALRDFIRDETKFADLNELKEQIKKDIQKTLEE